MTYVVERNLDMVARDGQILRADLYRPDDDERHPVLLLRTPYGKDAIDIFLPRLLSPRSAVAAGYAVVVQDVRASGASDGDDFFPYRDEGADSFDAVEWAAGLPCSNGAVGTYGISYLGGVAWQTAAEAPPSLRALSAVQAPIDHERVWWRGGALRLGDLVGWMCLNGLIRIASGRCSPSHAPDITDALEDVERCVRHVPLASLPLAHAEDPSFAPFFFQTLQHPTPDDWTRSILLEPGHRSMTAPVLIVSGWHDSYVSSDLDHFRRMRDEAATVEAREQTRIVIGPWTHGELGASAGDLGFGERASADAINLGDPLAVMQLRWFDRWLRGAHQETVERARVWLFVQGRNRWREEEDWPLASAKPVPWYLGAAGELGPSAPASNTPPDTYTYDPHDPCPTHGGAMVVHTARFRAGPVDQAPILSRRDVLTYTSAPLDEDLEVIGPIVAVLYASTSGRDTDWVVKLCDVHADGRTLSVTDGILRARYRNGLEQPVLLEPGVVEQYEVELDPTAMVFLKGHRLRVLVTSSDFPRHDRNPNTGEHGVDAVQFESAVQTIFHDAQRPSHLVLPTL